MPGFCWNQGAEGHIHDGTRELHVKTISTTSSGSIGGTATDAVGGVILNAGVTVQSQGTGESHASSTGASGIYLLPSPPVGTYRIEVKSPGTETIFLGRLEADSANPSHLHKFSSS